MQNSDSDRKSKYPSIGDKLVWAKAVRHLKKNDVVLADIISKSKLTELKLDDDHYTSLIRNIIFQQISGKAGNAILKRFKELYKGKFPTAKQFLTTPEQKVRAAGISPQKYSYLKDLCERIVTGKLEFGKFPVMDSESIIEELDAVRGIGRWTAEIYLMFCLGRADVVPYDDLGIRKGIQRVYKLRSFPEKERMMKISKKWQPYGSVASLYIWHSVDNGDSF